MCWMDRRSVSCNEPVYCVSPLTPCVCVCVCVCVYVCVCVCGGPTVLEVFNTLLKHLRVSVDGELADGRRVSNCSVSSSRARDRESVSSLRARGRNSWSCTAPADGE